MVLGSRPVTDLTHEHYDAEWEGALHTLLDEIALQRGGSASAASAGLPTASQSTDAAPHLDTLVPASASSASAPSVERLESAGAPSAAAARGGFSELTMAQKVARVREELSLDAALPIAKAVAEANAVMGIEGHGPLSRQVETLLTELGVLPGSV
jgi:hypothetical protein